MVQASGGHTVSCVMLYFFTKNVKVICLRLNCNMNTFLNNVYNVFVFYFLFVLYSSVHPLRYCTVHL